MSKGINKKKTADTFKRQLKSFCILSAIRMIEHKDDLFRKKGKPRTASYCNYLLIGLLFTGVLLLKGILIMFTLSVIPFVGLEPTSAILLLSGFAGIFALRRREE